MKYYPARTRCGINDTVGRALILSGENFEKKMEERFAKVEQLLEDSRKANSSSFFHLLLEVFTTQSKRTSHGVVYLVGL